MHIRHRYSGSPAVAVLAPVQPVQPVQPVCRVQPPHENSLAADDVLM